jgi:hypothetical protein
MANSQPHNNTKILINQIIIIIFLKERKKKLFEVCLSPHTTQKSQLYFQTDNTNGL